MTSQNFAFCYLWNQTSLNMPKRNVSEQLCFKALLKTPSKCQNELPKVYRFVTKLSFLPPLMFLPTRSNTHWRNVTQKKSKTLDSRKRKRKRKEGRGKKEEEMRKRKGGRGRKEGRKTAEGRGRKKGIGRGNKEETRRKREEGFPNRLLSQTNIYLLSMQVAISSLRSANKSSECIIINFHMTRTNIQGHLKQQ